MGFPYLGCVLLQVVRLPLSSSPVLPSGTISLSLSLCLSFSLPLSLYIYIYIHMHRYIYIYVCTHILPQSCTYTYIQIYTYAYAHPHIQVGPRRAARAVQLRGRHDRSPLPPSSCAFQVMKVRSLEA